MGALAGTLPALPPEMLTQGLCGAPLHPVVAAHACTAKGFSGVGFSLKHRRPAQAAFFLAPQINRHKEGQAVVGSWCLFSSLS